MIPTHRLIELPERADARGKLIFAQQDDQIPFPVKRFFVLFDVAPRASRGGHAHRAQHQLLVATSGAVTVAVDNGHKREDVYLDRPNLALYAPPMLWLDLRDFSAGASVLVLASDVYAESDYVRDWREFNRLTGLT